MPLLDYAFIAPVVAKHLSKALRSKNADERRREIKSAVVLLIASFQDDEEFMAEIRKVVS